MYLLAIWIFDKGPKAKLQNFNIIHTVDGSEIWLSTWDVEIGMGQTNNPAVDG